MPVYCYETEYGEVKERVFPMGKAPPFICEHGVRAHRSFRYERKGVPPTSGWPMECVASGVNAEDAGKLKAFLAQEGVKTEVTPDGNPIYKNHIHRRRALKARGLVDKSAYI